ncbi:RibD family protein [Tunicatimonas pelagia]|uniref:RibD family protein n=1 Tax=Tunicatimonas pelagia TaxID=931531 RepID=UPI0026662313|nr:RibD family protein [Tunicatimonas pelagia]WKN44099.1 RibD family protein [Tunicatimonas pelagia]
MTLENYWQGLLLLKKTIADTSDEVRFCFINFGEKCEVYVNRLPVPNPKNSLVLVIVDSEANIQHHKATSFYLDNTILVLDYVYELDEEIIDFLATYMPYCFLPIQAKKQQRAIAITHFAQSLDGKIATHQGDSKWIGNDDNLIHAHRMRALCSSILIGSHTLNYDHPSLTVRLVEGSNPRRVVICSTESDFSSLQSDTKNPVLVIGSGDDPCLENTEYVQLPSNDVGKIACPDILKLLFEKGLSTVYVEGGSATTSSFLAQKSIDVLQLHIAPLIFGSGLDSFTLPEIASVSEAVQFDRFYYKPIGDTFMFVGEMHYD